MGAMLIEVERITKLVGRCAVYERLYLGTGTTTSSAAFEGAIIELYICVLRYLVHAKEYYSKNTAGMNSNYSFAQSHPFQRKNPKLIIPGSSHSIQHV